MTESTVTEVPRDREPVLLVWLHEAAKGIAVIEMPTADGTTEWWVEAHNGLDDPEHVGSILARCATEIEAELVAAGLWALLEIDALRDAL